MHRLIAVLGFVMAFALLPAEAGAVRKRSTEEYTPLRKLGRGLADMTTGFLELPGNIAAESRDGGAAAGATIGFAKGLGMIPVRELVGVYNFVTAPIPVPSGYRPILEPEFPWQYFEGAPSARLSRDLTPTRTTRTARR